MLNGGWGMVGWRSVAVRKEVKCVSDVLVREGRVTIRDQGMGWQLGRCICFLRCEGRHDEDHVRPSVDELVWAWVGVP